MIKTDSFKTFTEFLVDREELQELEIVSTELRTVTDQKILQCCCYRPPDANQCWMDKFKIYLQTICDLYENIITAGDFNLPNIHWNMMENTSGANELVFVGLLKDHYLSQLNNTPTRGNDILDVVVTNMPDHVTLTQILSPEETSVFTDHHTITFEFSTFLKQPRKSTRTVYDYARGNLDALCAALQEIDLPSTISETSDNINVDWKRWKETFFLPFRNSYQKRKFEARIRFHG